MAAAHIWISQKDVAMIVASSPLPDAKPTK